jgi:PAS domain S-box-containing protein
MEREHIITLVVESEPEYAKLVYDMLASSKEIVFEPIIAGTLAEGIYYLTTSTVDVILLDPVLPDSYGLDTFMRIQEAAPEVPVVIYSSIGDAAAALSSVKWGAEDYIYRGEATSKLLCRSLSFAVERHQSRQRLRQSEEKSRAQYMGIPVPTYTYRKMNGRFVFVDYNEAARRLSEGGVSAFAGRTLDEIMNDQPDIRADIVRCFEERATIKREGPYRSKTTGKDLFLASSCVFVPPDLVMVHTEDITARKAAQQALEESERKYRTLIETIPNGIEEIDPEGTITYANATYEQIYGFSPGESVGKTIFDLMADEADRVRSVDELKYLVREEPVPTPYIVQVRAKAGEIRDIQIDWNYKRDREGKVLGFISVITDITERKRIEEALRESEETYRLLVENANEGISVTQDGWIRFINQKNCEMLGYSRQELMSRPFIGFVHADDQEFAIGHYRKSLNGIPVSQFISFRVLDKSGTIKRVLLNTVVITWREQPAVLTFMNDITDYGRKAASLDIIR